MSRLDGLLNGSEILLAPHADFGFALWAQEYSFSGKQVWVEVEKIEKRTPTPEELMWLEAVLEDIRIRIANRTAVLKDADIAVLEDYIIRIDKIIKANIMPVAVAVGSGTLGSPVSSESEHGSSVKQSIDRFLLERKIELRNPGENIDLFLERLYKGLLKVSIETLWNQQIDASTDPYTPDVNQEPLVGARKKVDLVYNPVVYTSETWMIVKSMGALCDKIDLYFDDNTEKRKAKELIGNRMKDVLQQISVWHNRTAVRREGYDVNKSGPDGVKKALATYANDSSLAPDFQKLFYKKDILTQIEIKFLEAIELNCAVWSVMALPKTRREQLRTRIDSRVWDIATEEKYRGAVPFYRADAPIRRELMEKLIQMGITLGLDEDGAKVAFHFGDSFRTGSGIDTHLDRTWGIENAGTPEEKEIVKVAALEGGPKGVSTGAYVQSITQREKRPDFNDAIGDGIINTVPQHAWMAQFDIEIDSSFVDFSEYGDKRSQLIEIFAVKDAVFHVKTWRATDTDKAVYNAAAQAINYWWKAAPVAAAKDPILVFPSQSGLEYTTTGLPEDTDLERLLRKYHGRTTPAGQRVAEFITNFTPGLGGGRNMFEITQKWLDADSHPITGDTLQAIKEKLKSLRDYYLDSFKIDTDAHPLDFLRTIKFLFFQDTRFVNLRIAGIIENAEVLAKSGRFDKDEKDKLYNKIAGYITYDLFPRMAICMFVPDFRTVAKDLNPYGKTKPQLLQLYNEIDFLKVEELVVKTKGGSVLPNTAGLSWLVNQLVLYRDAVQSDQQTIVGAGYAYGPDSERAQAEAIRTGRDELKVPVTRREIVAMLKEYGLGLGRMVKEVKHPKTGKPFYPLRPEYDEVTALTVTPQDVIDKIVFVATLFEKTQLQAGKSGKN